MLCLAGGTMGSLLVVFLRRAYIVDEQLPYPEGIACAEVLRSGASGSASAAPLAWGGIISAALKASQDILGFVPGTLTGARWVGRAAVAGSVNLSAALIGVGYIVGLGIASLVFLRRRDRMADRDSACERGSSGTARAGSSRCGASNLESRKRVISASVRCWSAVS